MVMRRPVPIALPAVTAALVLAATGCSSTVSKPTATAGATSPSSPSPAIEAVCLQGDSELAKGVTHFPGGNGHLVEAYTTGSGPVGVVLAHQRDADLCEWSGIWPDFAAKGYMVMAITMGGAIDTDVAKAAEQLRARGATQIVLVGASMGGTAALAAAGEVTPPVQAVVSLSGPADFGPADAFAAVKKFQVPVAYFAGEQDVEYATNAQSLYDATTEKDKTLHILKGDASHGVELWPDVKDEVLAFIAKHVEPSGR
jgi:pimeloyl-ACP methyl ester carboxylesterase